MGQKSIFYVEYDIANGGESAYYVQIFITLPNGTFFAKTTDNCNVAYGTTNSLSCNFTQHQYTALEKDDDKISQVIMISTDAIETEGTELTIEANVTSKSGESNCGDNMIKNTLVFIASSNIEVIGYESPFYGC